MTKYNSYVLFIKLQQHKKNSKYKIYFTEQFLLLNEHLNF